MRHWFLFALLLASLSPAVSAAVELKNIRPCYGPLGVTRYETKLLPGDVLFMTYDIEGLSVDPKSGKASYVTILELIDAQQKVLFKKETPNEVVPQLGGTRMPGDLHIIMGPKQAPGRYALKLTVHDKFGNDAKAFKYEFDVLPEGFGMVAVTAPAIGFPGQHYVPGFALVNLTLDGKKLPSAEITIRILDQSGTPVAAAVQMVLPKDTPENTDLEKANFVPLTYPVYLNRLGRYTMEIVAIDKNANNKRAELRFPFTVVDLSSYLGK